MLDAISNWLRATRRTFTWIYCSAILFPMAFAFVAAVILALRQHGGDAVFHRFFAIFYLALMLTLASVPRSILPILFLWLVVARFRPEFDRNRAKRYLGLLFLMLVAVFAHSKIYGDSFNFLWLGIGWLSLALPRAALPMLRGSLNDSIP